MTKDHRIKRSLGSVFPTASNNERAPHFTGKGTLQGQFIRTMVVQLQKSNNDQVEVNFAVWCNETDFQRFLTIEVSPRFVAKRTAQKKSRPVPIHDFFSAEPCRVTEQDDEHENDSFPLTE